MKLKEKRKEKEKNEGLGVYESWYELYDYIDRELFNSRLGKVLIELYCSEGEVDKEELELCDTYQGMFLRGREEKEKNISSIRINMGIVQFFGLREIFLMMCHEMTHYKLSHSLMYDDCHGKVFTNEMKKIGIETVYINEEWREREDYIAGGAAEKSYKKLKESGFRLKRDFNIINNNFISMKLSNEKRNIKFGYFLKIGGDDINKRYSIKRVTCFHDDDGEVCGVYRLYNRSEDHYIWLAEILDACLDRIDYEYFFDNEGKVRDCFFGDMVEWILDIKNIFKFIYCGNYKYRMKSLAERWKKGKGDSIKVVKIFEMFEKTIDIDDFEELKKQGLLWELAGGLEGLLWNKRGIPAIPMKESYKD